MSDLAKCVEYVNQLMAKSAVPPNPADVRQRITRLFEEGVDFKRIVNQFIARQHVKHEEKVFGLQTTDILTFSDLNEIEKVLGINEPTAVNKELWTEKFKSGRAKYCCPRCGYAGNDEFKTIQNGTDHLICYQCGYFEDVRYFTRTWTPEQQAEFEAERRAKRAAADAKRIGDAELRNRQTNQSAPIHAEAVRAAEAIDRFIWIEMGDDADSYAWDDAVSGWMVRKLGQLMSRAAFDMTVTDELVAYFKSNLKLPEDFSLVRGEFERVAAKYATKFKEGL